MLKLKDEDLLDPVRFELNLLCMNLPVEWTWRTPRPDWRIFHPEKRKEYIEEHLRSFDDGLTEDERKKLRVIMQLPFEPLRLIIAEGIPPKFRGLDLQQILDALEREQQQGLLPPHQLDHR